MAKILIVDDDSDLVETYTDLLETRGHTIICASGIREATDHVLESKPEIITLDLNLPGTSNSVFSTFIQSAKALNRCRIIVISGHPEMIAGQGWMNEVDLVLTKPINNHQLIAMIDRLLSL